MKTFITYLFIFLLGVGSLSGQPSWGGYFKAMPALQLDRNFSQAELIGIFHNRINTRWNLRDDLRLVAEGRNRLLYNRLFTDYPFFADFLGQDAGLVDLSWIWLEQGPWIGHTNIDRLYLDWRHNNWQVRAGRQRINWGITLVSNPNDLFNTYSFFDFDYPERPGADAIRLQYHRGFASRLELAYSPARNSRESTGAFLWTANINGSDLQALAGYFRNRSALGFGWASSIGGAGFKGEATWFYDLQGEPGIRRGNVVAATGFDYIFSGGTFLVMEVLYNGGYGRLPQEVVLITQPLRPDNIMFSKYAVTASAQHPVTTIMQGGLAFMALPDVEAMFVMPSLNYSLARDLDLEFVAQIFTGSRSSTFGQAGSSWFVALQYSF